MKNQADTNIKVEQLVGFIKIVLLVAVVLTVGGLGVLGYQSFQERNAEEAFSALFAAERLEELALREAGESNRDYIAVMKSWSDEKQKEYASKLELVMNEYSSSAAAKVAALKLGRWHMENASVEQAEQSYRRGLENLSRGESGDFYRGLLIDALALSLEIQKNYSEAYKYFENGTQLVDHPVAPLSYLGAARVARTMGEEAKAQAMYDKVIEKYPESQFERRARALKALQLEPHSKTTSDDSGGDS